jgi:hypothetical protein
MYNPLNTPENSLLIGQNKDKHFEAQKLRVFEAFMRQPSTMLMVSIETGILRANICRYVSGWQKEGKICLIKRDLCKISKHNSGYYTTNLNFFNQPLNQF